MKASISRKISRRQVHQVLREWDESMTSDAVAFATRRSRVGTHPGAPSERTGKHAGYLGKFAEATRGTDICDLSVADVENYFAGCADGRLAGKSGSYNGHFGALKAFLGWAVIRGYILPEDAARLIGTRKREKDNPDEMFRIDLAGINRLLDCAGESHPRNRFILAIGATTGFRENEVLAVRLDGLNFEAEETRVWRKKTRDWLELPWLPEFKRELLRWLPRYAQEVGYENWEDMIAEHPDWPLVPAFKAGASWDIIPGQFVKSTVKKVVKQALKRAGMVPPQGLDGIGLHTLRRSLADAIDARGGRNAASLEDAQLILGHSSPQTTKRYLRRDRNKGRLRDIAAMGLSPDLPGEETAEVIPLSALSAKRAARQAR